MECNDFTREEVARHRAAYFSKVVTAYAECRAYPAVCGVTYDEFLPPNSKLTPTVIEFLADVDAATHRALDSAGLYPAWERIVAEQAVPMNTRAKVTNLCAKVYIARRLQPFDYFRYVKKRTERSAS